ncbi:GMC oxidoreductase [Viridothelium virens]|uniref:GMC oxidoreductase n=1 Tax=Viridothelium virens TaxID=1048519 RepID=A0A6A6HGV6_VIRVR|nr:GMC oxidoreductase [Viridothelium virens]
MTRWWIVPRSGTQGLALGSPKLTDPALFKGLPCDWIINDTVPAEILEDALDKETQIENSFAHSILQRGRPHVEQLVCYAPLGVPGIPTDGSHVAVSTVLLLPTSRGSINLASASPNDPPMIDSNYYATSTDQQVLIWASRRALKLMLLSSALRDEIEAESPPQIEGLSLEPLTPDVPDSVIDDRIRKTGVQHHHSGGTAAIGSVTDTECRVKGVKGLRIADASVVPVTSGGHPQSTLYAMAEQVADMIIRS